MADLKANVKRMIEAGVPEDEIGNYIREVTAMETAAADKYLKDRGSVMAPEKGTDWARAGAQVVGGIAGGAAATPLSVATGNPGPTIVGAGLGDAIGGQVYDLSREFLARMLGKRLPPSAAQTPDERMSGAAWDANIGMLVPPAIEGGRALLSPIKRGVAGRALRGARGDAALVLDTVNRVGMKPTAGMVTDNPAVHNLEQSIRNTPGGGRIMAERGKENLDAARAFAESLARRYGNVATPEQVGESMRRGAMQAKGRFWDTVRKLDEQVESFIPNDEQIPIANTLRWFEENADEVALHPELEALRRQFLGKRPVSKVPDINTSELIDTPQDTIQAHWLKKRKSGIGKVFDKTQPTEADFFKKELYKAVRQDIEDAAVAKGPDAAAAIDRFNRYYRLGKGDKRGGRPGELDTINWMLGQAESGRLFSGLQSMGKGGSKQLRRVFRQLPKETQGDIRASMLSEMGAATPGMQNAAGDVWSFNAFLTNANRMSDEAFEFLFGQNKAARADLQDLMEVSEFVRELEKAGNTSKTANISLWQNLLKPFSRMLGYTVASAASSGGSILQASATAAGLGVADLVATTAYQKRMADLLTDQKFIKWLAQGARGSITNADFMPHHMLKLSLLASQNPEMRDSLVDYTQTLGYPIRIEHKRISQKKGS